MKHTASIFSADFRDGRVHIGSKTYPAGTFCVNLLNQYYENDTAARIAVFKSYNYQVRRSLDAGYLHIPDYIKAGEEILMILQALPLLPPFGMLDMDAERNRISQLFTEEIGVALMEYFRRKGIVGQMTEVQRSLGVLPTEYDKTLFEQGEQLFQQVVTSLRFYDEVSDQMRIAFQKLRQFIVRLEEADRLDEAHLLPLALEIFGATDFAVKTEYVAIYKSSKSSEVTTARRLHFDSYLGFILTDFFEGLHYGHYPRQCEICNRYFLMTSARKQKYCNGLAPYVLRGKKVPCVKYAAAMNRKERAADDPVTDLYSRRCAAIRAEKSRGTITVEFAAKAIQLAKEYKEKAQTDRAYANNQYPQDMERDALYTHTDKQLK